jgi:hypothetical protein
MEVAMPAQLKLTWEKVTDAVRLVGAAGALVMGVRSNAV